jgi:hypothetical protein
MRRLRTLIVSLVFLLTLAPVAAWADHIPPGAGVIPVRLDAPVTWFSEGPVRFVNNAQAGRSFAGTLGEVEPFERGGRKYTVAGSSYYGFSVLDITDPVAPTVISEYSSGFGCPTNVAEAIAALETDDPVDYALGYGGFENDISFAPDGSWVALGMDAVGRCHDPAYGGIEIVDLSDLENPRTLHLVRNIGMSHSVTIDPAHPWLAYISTSDADDVIEIVDLKQCLGREPGDCKTTVARAVLDPEYLPGLADPTTKDDRAADGCHDIRFKPNRIYCAAVGSTLILDDSKVLKADGTLTGTHLTEGSNACETVDADPIYAPGILVTDCAGWTKDAFKQRKAEPVDMRFVSVVVHDGSKPADEDIAISHQADAIADGTIMIVTDERGGGVGADECPAGGIWFYDIRDERNPVLMQQPDGSPGVFQTKYNIPSIAGNNPNCTVHYGREYADENLLVFAWYTNGTRILRYVPDFTKTPAQITFEEIAAIAPISSTFDAMGVQRNPADPDELLVYTSDLGRGLDVFAVKTPRLTRAAAFGAPTAQPPPAPPKVGGAKSTRGLAGTGLPDPMVSGFALLALALAVRRILLRFAD